MSIPVFLKPFDDTHFCVAKYHQCVNKNYFLDLHDLNTQKHSKLFFFKYMVSYKGFASLTNMQADLVSSFTGGLNSDDKIIER